MTIAHPPASERALRFDTLAGVAWLDILHDTTLERLVQIGARAEPHVQSRGRAHSRVSRRGGERGHAVSAERLDQRQREHQPGRVRVRSVLGYRAARLTGDMAWELDFWGKFRRGYEAANADAASQDAAERAVLLSLVSDVATGYLQLLELDQERAIARAHARVAARDARSRAPALRAAA